MEEMELLKKEEARRRRIQAEKRRRQKRRRRLLRNLKKIITLAILSLCFIGILCAGIVGIYKISNNKKKQQAKKQETQQQESESQVEKNDENAPLMVGDVEFMSGFTAYETENTIKITKADNEDIISKYVILIDESTNEIVAQRKAKKVISPASMTKILTILVAAEHIEDIENTQDTVKITREMTDYVYANDCSAVGFEIDEEVPIKDLFYGTILPSGADAAVALATYVGGSQDGFMDLMNAKLEELGLAETAHFTNCVGLYDEEHYCTIYDMAMILKAALANDFCREVLSAHKYTTTPTKQHPEGIQISNWFLRRIEDKESGGKTQCAKTGFVNQSGSCAASYFLSDSGRPYICVTAKSESSWKCIYDQVAIYQQFTH